MKVSMNTTVEVSDDQLILIANLLDGKVSRRRAKREEARAWVWSVGEGWPVVLHDRWEDTFADNSDLF